MIAGGLIACGLPLPARRIRWTRCASAPLRRSSVATVSRASPELELDLDDLDDDERAERDAAIERGWEQAKAGPGRPASEIIAELKNRR